VATLDAKIMEAKVVFWGIRLYKTILDFIFGFMLTAIIFQFAGVKLTYALAPALLFALLKVAKEYGKSNIVRRLEGEYRGLDESLTTAVEYKGMRNPIVEDLVADVTKHMDDVESSAFLNSKNLAKRVYALVFLSFILLTATVLNLRSIAFESLDFLLDTTNMADTVDAIAGKAGTEFDTLMGNRWEQSNFTDENKEKLGADSGGERPGVSEGPIPGTGGGAGADSGGDIYGEASSASIEGRDVDFKLHPEYGGEIEIRETGGRARENVFQLEDVQSAEECEDCVVGPEHEEMVRRYFEKILPET
jgi:hypothetical protein